MAEVLIQRAAFIGSGALLTACAEIWVSSGNAIHGIVTSCPIATAWCERNGVSHIAPKQDQAAWLGSGAFDYLFSIVNHAITPAEILALPTRRAINYHDSPLPKYAGFNATSWAILNNETRHAVTWHVMTADVDGGDILLQQAIDILDEDVAFSLGAKCIEAGRDTFKQLVDTLRSEVDGTELQLRSQGAREGFHLRSDRPGLSIIDFTRTVHDIRNLVRATNLGSDDNWMCRAKLALSSDIYIAEHADIVMRPQAAPGTVVAIDGKGIEIAARDGVLRFEMIATLEGAPVDLLAIGVRPGDVLAGPQDSAAGNAADAVLTRHERFWVERLATSRSPTVAGVKLHTGAAEPALLTRDLPDDFVAVGSDRLAALTAALLAYVVRTGEDESFDLALAKFPPAGLERAYASHAPFRVAVDKTLGFDALKAEVAQEFAVQNKRVSYARDAAIRYQSLRTRKATPDLAIGIHVASIDGLAAASVLSNNLRLALVIPPDGNAYAWAYDSRSIDSASVRRLVDRFDVLLMSGQRDGATPLNKLDMLPEQERKLLLDTWQDTASVDITVLGIHQLFDAQVARTPDAVALRFRGESLTYRQLADRSDAVAEILRSRGVAPGVLVAVCMERSLDLVVGLMGVLKAGGAYVPLDPAYPIERLTMMLEDSQAKVVLTQQRLANALPSTNGAQLFIEEIAPRPANVVSASPSVANDLAYVIFTSGSTGRPKGVMVRHRNVTNFFTGMDQRIGVEPGVWLAVTSVSFDISVLEIFWTLTRGFEVVIQGESDRASISRAPVSASRQPMDFSLFYFAAGQGNAGPGGAYRLLLEGAKFADTHDFSAVWTPERHFHEFGGPYPNPAVTTAALATITSRVSLRAGSVVLPLHSSLRVAEDWSVIDQISGGRVGLSFASGWHVDDFVFMPQNYERRREVMLESIDTVMKLWRGEKVETVNGQGKTISVGVLPRPVQANPPMWIASAGSIDTFKVAGRLGANVLTNMLGQDIDDLRNKFAAYRKARREAGHEGPGTITVMLHTFVCEDTEKARELAREPFCNYLKSSFDLIKVAPSMFPAFRQPSLADGDGKGFDAASFTPEDMDALMEHAFDRYFETAGLFGSPAKALAIVDRLKSIGATEVACLIDFGIDTDTVLESLPYLDQLRQMSNAANDVDANDYSIPAQIRDHGVTHLQCTPSLARIIINDPDGLAGLRQLKRLLLGGEALPVDLAELLTAHMDGELHNMYGPTETTIWSTTSYVRAGQPITIGKPIANTVIRILNDAGQPMPIGVAGELYIGGNGVAAGYLGRPDLTSERFVADPCGTTGLLYKTGDLARYTPAGDIEFLGRSDFQVKLNGYRIELGEIEAVLGRHECVGQSVVSVRSDDGNPRLIAYVTPVRQNGSVDVSTQQVAQWEGLWDGAYREAAGSGDARFNTIGWNDSATGLPIPQEQMREWLDGVEQSILRLRPERVLEIGFGSGMVLYRLLPHVEHYTGVDLSARAVEAIHNELVPAESSRISLYQQAAHDLNGIADRSCDTVIINSVAQYFPDAAYLEKVLRRASEIVSDGGSIFVGDVRALEQFEAFHTSVALRQSSEGASAAEIAQHIQRRMSQDGELIIGEAFFHALLRDLPRASRIDVQLKPGLAENEMSAFRYDVVIRIGASAGGAIQPITVSLHDLNAALERAAPAVIVRDILNARVADLHAVRPLLAKGGNMGLAQLRSRAEAHLNGAIEPMSLTGIHPDYDIQVVPARSGDPGRFDAVFRSRNVDAAAHIDVGAPEHAKPAADYVRSPRLPEAGLPPFDELRAYLRGSLPEYMVPSAFVVLDAFPLTPNGKIDRKALPRPVQAPAVTPVGMSTYVAPSNSIESQIADVWKAILGVTHVGLKDNIFDLGANSLLTVQANQRLSNLLGRKITLVSMFRYPTVEALAAHLSDAQPQLEAASKQIHERDARKKDAAVRRRELRAGQR
ncbi:MAG TPA: LLM class flavin-dependent oxidoreductase [Hyphomonadaceae bacterium]|nr:LLM class flavin-dependent oxidoreductase [Hyphomonadaceae bacterium]